MAKESDAMMYGLSEFTTDGLNMGCRQDDEQVKAFGVENDDDRGTEVKRKRWDRRAEFLLATIGYAVGLGNIWRFPWLLMKNGGGAFLIPYSIMLLIEGLPLLYLELAVGQRFQLGAVPLWRKLSKYSSGLGLSQFLTIRITNSIYVLVLAWCCFYFAMSFKSPLPWSTCPKTVLPNSTQEVDDPYCTAAGSTVYYWYNTALDISTGLNDSNGLKLNLYLALCLLITFILVFLSLFKGVISTGKVVYFTALYPYVGLLVFLIRGLTLEGYEEGLKFLFKIEFSRLKDPYVWLQAATQIFFSLSLSGGGMIAYASYNPIHQDVFVDAVTICVINAATSLLAGLAVFCLLGHRAHFTNLRCLEDRMNILSKVHRAANQTLYSSYDVTSMTTTHRSFVFKNLEANISGSFAIPVCSVEKMLEESPPGTGLAFITLTDVIDRLPGSSVFAVLFFLMLLTMGLDSTFGGMESTVTSVRDLKYFRKCRLQVILGTFCLLGFLIGLIVVTRSGEYFFQILNIFAVNIPLIVYALAELLTTAWLYGINRFSADIEHMTGRSVGLIWKVLWCFVSPAVLLTILVASIYKFITGDVMYQKWVPEKGKVVKAKLPFWSEAVGWMVFVFCIIWLPIGFIFGCYEKRRKGALSLVVDEDNNDEKL